jgi:pyrroloquinoline quinone biosynthesis protein D
MSDAAPPDPLAMRPCVARLYRLQWEEAQQAHVLLFPEGMVKLNRSAGEILRRCDGEQTTGQIITELETAFEAAALCAEVWEAQRTKPLARPLPTPLGFSC